MTRVIAGVELEGQVVFDSQLHAPRPAPVAESQACRFVNLTAAEDRGEGILRFVVRALLPAQCPVVSVLRLDGDRTCGMAPEDGCHRRPQILQVTHLDLGLVEDRLGFDDPGAELHPRKVREEELWPRNVPLARPGGIVNLNVIEPGRLVEQAEHRPGLLKLLEFGLRLCESVEREVVQSVDLACD